MKELTGEGRKEFREEDEVLGHLCAPFYIRIFYCDIHNVYKDASGNCLVKYFTAGSTRPTEYPQCTNRSSESDSIGTYIDACTSESDGKAE